MDSHQARALSVQKFDKQPLCNGRQEDLSKLRHCQVMAWLHPLVECPVESR